jgi:hypothetical protein
MPLKLLRGRREYSKLGSRPQPRSPAAVALHQGTAAVPIVFLQVANPIGSGLVASLARPGANSPDSRISSPQ